MLQELQLSHLCQGHQQDQLLQQVRGHQELHSGHLHRGHQRDQLVHLLRCSLLPQLDRVFHLNRLYRVLHHYQQGQQHLILLEHHSNRLCRVLHQHQEHHLFQVLQEGLSVRGLQALH